MRLGYSGPEALVPRRLALLLGLSCHPPGMDVSPEERSEGPGLLAHRRQRCEEAEEDDRDEHHDALDDDGP